MDARAEIRRSWDLTLIIILSVILALFIYLVPEFPGRIVLGLPFILFFPGYALIATLFPEKSSLDLIERIALSFGLSIAVVPLIGFGLNYTPFGIRLDPILWSLITFNAIFCIVGMWRRSVSAEPFLPFKLEYITSMVKSEFNQGTKTDRILSIILVLAILSSVVALIYIVAVPRQGEAFSEFYILGPSKKAADYPKNIVAGIDETIIIGIANHNHRAINYSVEIWLANYTYSENDIDIHRLYFMDVFNETLEHVPVNLESDWTSQYEKEYALSVPLEALDGDLNSNFKLWFILNEDIEPFPGREDINYQENKEVRNRFLDKISDKDAYTLNLNLNVSEGYSIIDILDPEGNIIDDLSDEFIDVNTNETTSVSIEVTNKYPRDMNYSVEIWLVDHTNSKKSSAIDHLYLLDILDIESVGEDELIRENYTFSIPHEGNYTFWFIINEDDMSFSEYGFEKDYNKDEKIKKRFIRITTDKYSYERSLSMAKIDINVIDP